MGGTDVPAAPEGWERLRWIGPGFLWMVSAAGSGELLFTPRVASLFGYALLWALLLAVALKWVINREIGRYTVCTGKRLLDGFAEIPGPGRWALWVILVPQVLVAVASIAGLAGAGATAILLVAPGGLALWTTVSILAAGGLVLWGKYKGVELAATVLGIALAIAALAAAFTVGPDYGAVGEGLVPALPAGLDQSEILPWLGFMMSGAAGLMWYSYWLHAKGYAGAGGPPRRMESLQAGDRQRLRAWIRQMTLDNSIAVAGVLLVTVAFLVLGAELLRPEGLVPHEDDVAPILGRLLGDVWGAAGFWFMVLALFVGFWTTVLSDQDGWGRLFSHGTRRLLLGFGYRGRWSDEPRLNRTYVVGLVIVLPILLFLAVGKPVGLLKLAGAIEAVHIPVVGALTMYLNRRALPKDLQPRLWTWGAFALAVLFFVLFAGLYVLQVAGVGG